MKKIDFKRPKYIVPMIILLPLVFLIYNVSSIFSGTEETTRSVVTDSINTALPEADEQSLEGKMAEMDKAQWGDDSYTAVTRLGEEEEERDEASQGYTETELNNLDRVNAERQKEAKAKAELERTLAESRRHVNNYQSQDYTPRGRAYGSRTSRTQYDEIEDYANALEEIQNRNRKRNKQLSSDYSNSDESSSGSSSSSTTIPPQKVKEVAPEIVHKEQDKGADKFHTINSLHSADAALIKAIIDKTTKARNGTRLRFKLLDNVTIKGTTLKKGTYLYGTVNGFSGQRVTASITSILVNDKFIKVSLSVYDNDGMEGFYVPSSVWRTFVKDAGANAVSNGMQLNNGMTSAELSGEAVALQALQNIYSSASSAVSNNIRQDKARIKYNTTVYLINTSQTEEQ